MKSTGIVRRIDDLGRIVIPKEIRKTLKIKEGESLEIFINNDEIIFKKFSNMNDMENIFEKYVKILSDIVGGTILITDREKIISCNDAKKDLYLNEKISDTLEEFMEKRDNILSNDISEIEITNNIRVESFYYIVPIIVNSDVSGLLIMLSNKAIDDNDKMTIDIVNKILINYME